MKVLLLAILLTLGAGPDADFKEGGVALSYEQIVDSGYSVVGYPGELVIAPGGFGERFLEIAWCESRYDRHAIGALGELGSLQIHRVHQEPMAQAGLDIRVERDRIRWAVNLYRAYLWRPWSCSH